LSASERPADHAGVATDSASATAARSRRVMCHLQEPEDTPFSAVTVNVRRTLR
jgi:hypothetical protein